MNISGQEQPPIGFWLIFQQSKDAVTNYELTKIFSGDTTFELLSKRLKQGVKRKRGRPCSEDKLNLAITNKLLLQLDLLREDLNCPLTDIQDLFELTCSESGKYFVLTAIFLARVFFFVCLFGFFLSNHFTYFKVFRHFLV